MAHIQFGNASDRADPSQWAMDSKWLKEQLEKPGFSQAELARRLGLAPPIVNKMVMGKRRILATEAEVIRAYLAEGNNTSSPAPSPEVRLLDASRAVPHVGEMPRDVPVLGTVAGGAGGLQMNGEPLDWVRRPPRLKGRVDVFAVLVEELSMVPRYGPGDLVYVERLRHAAPGDHVVVEVKDAADADKRAILKKLVSLTASKIVLEQYNPPKVFEVDRKKVATLYRVMTMMDLLGV